MTMLVRGGAVAGSALPATATTGQVLQWNGSAWVAATPSASGTTPNATPTVPGLVQLAGDLAGTATAPTVAKLNGATPAAVATSGAYTDLTGRPALATVATSGAYTDLTGRPALATVATTGSYGDLTGRPLLATVATTGSYGDLTGAPTVPTTYVRAKTAATTTTATAYANDPDLLIASLPVGTYTFELYAVAAAGNTVNTGVQVSATGATGSAAINNNGTTSAWSTFAAAIGITAGGRANFVGSVVATSAAAFVVTTSSTTPGSQAGLAAGSWLRLTKVA